MNQQHDKWPAKTQPSAPVLSVLVTSRNRPNLLVQCLESLKANASVSQEVIVADDSDDTWAVFGAIPKRLSSEIIYLPTGWRLGFARNANRALLRARGWFITVPPLSEDCTVSIGWDITACRFLLSRPDIGQVAFHVLRPDGRTQHKGGFWPDRLQTRVAGECDYVGKGLATRAIVDAVGLFDEQFYPMYGEDADWSFRVRELGFGCACCEEARITHHHTHTNEIDAEHRRKVNDKWAL